MTRALLLHMAGPLQSWGDSSRWDYRTTLDHPTRSGVLGILAAALGYRHGRDLSDLEPIQLTVRVDRPGHLIRDFHTVGGGDDPKRKLPRARGGRRPDPIVSHRYYLSDAAFTVAVDGPSELIARVERALRAPVFGTFLGRRSCPPAGPLVIGATSDPVEDLRSVVPLDRPAPLDEETVEVEFIVEDSSVVPEGVLARATTTRTRPIRYGPDAMYGTHTTTRWVEDVSSELCGGRGVRYLDALTAWRSRYAAAA